MEIVTRPDLRSAEDARAYVQELRGDPVATGASDARMEEGSLRVDANVSVRPAGRAVRHPLRDQEPELAPALGRAIEYEARRQIDLLEAGQEVVQETRHWDEEDGRTHSLRSKEEATDYRYFPEPDLVPLNPEPAWVEAAAASLRQAAGRAAH